MFRKTSKAIELKFHKNSNPIDITGWTIYFTVKSKMELDDSQAEIYKDITDHLDAPNGRSLISLTTEDTDLKGNFYYDIKFKSDNDDAGILYHGQIKFREPVTTRG